MNRALLPASVIYALDRAGQKGVKAALRQRSGPSLKRPIPKHQIIQVFSEVPRYEELQEMEAHRQMHRVGTTHVRFASPSMTVGDSLQYRDVIPHCRAGQDARFVASFRNLLFQYTEGAQENGEILQYLVEEHHRFLELLDGQFGIRLSPRHPGRFCFFDAASGQQGGAIIARGP